MSHIVPAPTASVFRCAALACALAAGAAPALAGTPGAQQFSSAITDFGVDRHEVSIEHAGTWAISMKSLGDANMFVSTESSFRPHDAVCGGDTTCTVTVEADQKLYVFVHAAGSAEYDIIATPTTVTARR